MRILMILMVVLMFGSCVKNKKGVIGQDQNSNKVFEVTEVLQSTSYTYMKVKENGEEKWMAATKQEVANGDVFYYDEALQMNNFHSKDLNRDFEIIYFVNNISKTPFGSAGELNPETHTGKIETPQIVAEMKKGENEITVAHLYAKKTDYSGKEIEIRGKVVKVVKEVMGKNWVHIQDGTNSDGKFDLTVTTTDLPELNDIITFKGKITIDKDFGYGYSYEIIMEDAAITAKTEASKEI